MAFSSGKECVLTALRKFPAMSTKYIISCNALLSFKSGRKDFENKFKSMLFKMNEDEIFSNCMEKSMMYYFGLLRICFTYITKGHLHMGVAYH